MLGLVGWFAGFLAVFNGFSVWFKKKKNAANNLH